MKIMKKMIFTLLALVMVAMTASADVPTYKLTKGKNLHGTTVIKVGDAEVTSASEKQTVTVIVTPETGYSVAAVVCEKATSWGKAKSRGTIAVGSLRFTANKVKDADNTFSFEMPASNVDVSVSYIESMNVDTKEADNEEKAVDNVQVGIAADDEAEPYIDTESGKTVVPVTVNSINVPVQTDMKDLTVVIKPQTESADGGTVFEVQKILKNSFVTDENTNSQVVAVVFEESKNPIEIEDGAMKPNGRLLKVQTALSMLDDYANMTTLAENVKEGIVSATTKPKNKYWTFSSGVDVLLPKGVKAFKVLWTNNEAQIVELTDAELTLEGGHRGIKANNGVLLSCDSGEGGADYEVVASPGAMITGAKPATTDAKSYTDNCLVPTIEAHNYAPASNYRMMHANKFYNMKAIGEVPACKAVLKVK